jgi:1A family penicillin-binding protein
MGRKNKKKQKPSSYQLLLLLLQIIGDTLLILPLRMLYEAIKYRKIKRFITVSVRIIQYTTFFTYHVARIQLRLMLLSLAFFFKKKVVSHVPRFHRPFPKQKILYKAKPEPKNLRMPQFPHVKQKTQRMRPRKIHIPLITRLVYIAFGGAIVFFLIVIPFGLYMIVKELPNPNLLKTRHIAVTSKIFDRRGVLLYEIFADENRTPLPLSEIPDVIKHATIAIEDKDFYQHTGFSLAGIIRAAWETIVNKQLQGGSTITQQLIKSTLLTPEVSVQRKLKELILAYWAEKLFTKEQILEMYLNQVSFGGTAWGIESAARTYFGKSAKQVTLPEAAFLAGLPQAPSEYSPFSGNKQKAIQRQHEVLRRMTEDGYITPEEAEKAKTAQLSFIAPRIPIKAPHFVWYVKEYLEKQYGRHMVEKGGLQVTTTLDIELQDKVQTIVSSHVNALAKLQVGNGAALVNNPKTGEILAMVGSKDYFDTSHDGNVNVTTALRQPGSSIKVITYAKALENRTVTATTLLEDLPVSYPIAGQPPYQPVNYDGKFHGWVPVRLALANSYNIPAVRLLHMIGVDAMIDKGKEMGIDTWTERSRFGLSLTLGGGEVRMTDMAEVYSTLATLGKRLDLHPVLRITDYTGRTIKKIEQTPVQVLSPEVAWIIGNILSDNWARSQAFGTNSKLVIPGKTVAVKTGTTNEKRDNWAIGYTPSFVVTVWVGNNDNTPMHPYLTSGVTGAASIWHDVMVELLKDTSDEVLPKPDGIVAIPCYGNRTEYFIRGTEPRDWCGLAPTASHTQSERRLNPESTEQNKRRHN